MSEPNPHTGCPDRVAHRRAESFSFLVWDKVNHYIGAVLLAGLLATMIGAGSHILFGRWVPIALALVGAVAYGGVWSLSNLVSLLRRGRPLFADEDWPTVPPVHTCPVDDSEVR